MILTLLALMFGTTTELEPRKPSLNIPEQIAETIVFVNNSSGVVVYSDETSALVLTSNHVVDDEIEAAACTGCDYGIKVKFLHLVGDIFPLKNWETYGAVYIETNPMTDLALILIKPNKLLYHASLSRKEPRLGDDVWVIGNPIKVYRSLKKGILSSKDRSSQTSRLWEVSGGIIYGSSGGGVFNMDGELIGTLRSIELYNSHQCYIAFGGVDCVGFPITDIGYAVPRYLIREFLLNSSFGDYFNYLR